MFLSEFRDRDFGLKSEFALGDTAHHRKQASKLTCKSKHSTVYRLQADDGAQSLECTAL